MSPTADQGIRLSPKDMDAVMYTVLIRLPFPRGDFVDPPSVYWDSEKDRELWELLPRASGKGGNIDWQKTAAHFNVSLSFLSQQVAWLYERQLSQVRDQLRKVNRPSSVGNSPIADPVLESGTTGGHAMTRGGNGSRLLSSLSHRPKERVASQGQERDETPQKIRGHPMSRNASTSTITKIQKNSSSTSQRHPTERQSSFAPRRQSHEASHRSVDASPKYRQHSEEREASPSAVASDSSSSSSSDPEALHPMARSRAFLRPPRYSSTKTPLNRLSDADEEDEDSPFLPFSGARPATPPTKIDPGATVKISPKRPVTHHQVPYPSKNPKAASLPQAVHSSSSSTQSQPQSRDRPSQNPLSTLSPKQRRIAKEGSDGTPSMDSSFSDLNDASITQSALEEALANEMTHGGVASRMSTISQALRSRYL